MYKIKIEEIEIEVTRKKVKNLQLTVKSPDGNVKITAPMFVNETQVRQFAESKIEWIRKHKKKYQNYVNREEIHYEAGEVHYFMGKPYILDVINHNKLPKIKINENRIELYIKPGSNKTEREKAIWDW